jgi:Uma2 family endonuclease
VTCREPDFVVLSEDLFRAMRRDQRSLVTLDMPAPSLVVEVVSPGEPDSDNYRRDYVEKRIEYAARGIPEYWLIDPMRQVVIILCINDGQYQETVYSGAARLISLTFPTLELTAGQILNAGQ